MSIQIIAIVFFVFSLIAPPQQGEDIRQRLVVVTVLNADGSPAAETGMELSIREPLSRTSCTTNQDGRCEIQFGSNEDLVNGVLLVVGSGRKTILFKGDSVEIEIKLNESGVLEVHSDTHSHEPGEDDHTHPEEELENGEAVEATVSNSEPVIESVEAIESDNDDLIVESVVENAEKTEVNNSQPIVEDVTQNFEVSETATDENSNNQIWLVVVWLAGVLLVGIIGVGAWILRKEGLWT